MEQDGRLRANASGLGRTCCKRERYEATEPVRLPGKAVYFHEATKMELTDCDKNVLCELDIESLLKEP